MSNKVHSRVKHNSHELSCSLYSQAQVLVSCVPSSTMFTASLLYFCVDPLFLLEQVFNSTQKRFAYVPTCRNSFKKQVIFNPYPQSTIQLKLGVAVSGSQVYVTIQAKPHGWFQCPFSCLQNPQITLRSENAYPQQAHDLILHTCIHLLVKIAVSILSISTTHLQNTRLPEIAPAALKQTGSINQSIFQLFML